MPRIEPYHQSGGGPSEKCSPLFLSGTTNQSRRFLQGRLGFGKLLTELCILGKALLYSVIVLGVLASFHA